MSWVEDATTARQNPDYTRARSTSRPPPSVADMSGKRARETRYDTGGRVGPAHDRNRV